MANNTRFKALQTEAMSRLMATLKTEDQSLDQLTKKGLDFMKYSTELRNGFLEFIIRDFTEQFIFPFQWLKGNPNYRVKTLEKPRRRKN